MTGVVPDEGSRRALLAVMSRLPRARRRQLGGLVALMLFGGAAELCSIGALVPLLTLVGRTGFADGPGTGIALGLFALAVLAAAGLRLWLNWATQRVVLGAGHELTVEIQRRTLLQPYSYHVRHHSSAFVASLEKVQSVIFGVLLPLVQAAAALIIGTFIAIALLRIAPFISAGFGAAVALAYAVAMALTGRRLSLASSEIGAAYDARVRLVQDSVGAIRDILLDSSQAATVAAFASVDRRFADARARIALAGAAPRFVIEALGMIALAAAGVLLAGRTGGLVGALPAIGALALGAQRLLPLLQQLHQGWAAVAGSRAVLGDVAALLDLPVPDRSADDAAGLPFRHALELERVGFAYEGSDRRVLDEISLTIPAGARLALVGRTGSGKSTLADLIMGLLTPTSGRILVDGVPLSPETVRDWQRAIGHVPQAIFLTDTSLADNISLAAPGAPIDDARLERAVAAAELAAFIAGLPDGLATRVGERGIRLSGGQRQRVGLARALYKQAPFLILDEATNALDSQTEAAVLATLDALQRDGHTVLVITHRPSTIAGCTMIVRLAEGRLAGDGPDA